MVLFRRSQSGKHIDQDYHLTRHAAYTGTFDISEWSEEERLRYDLDDAWVDGKYFRRNFEVKRDIDTLGSNGFNILDLDDR